MASKDIMDRLSEDSLKVAKWLHRAGVPHSTEDSGGFTPLHRAVTGGETELVKFLISIGATLNPLDRMKRTPLHYAAAYGHAEICGILIKAGGDPKILDMNGVSAIDIIENPGAILPEDALKYLNITQRPVRKIQRLIHPELYPNDSKLGWIGGTGGWGEERLEGFENDMSCDSVDQYFANEITSEEIYHKYFARNAPVLIRGLINDWPVINKYSHDTLKEEFGGLGVQVSDIPYATKFGGREHVDMKLGQYIDEMRAHKIIGGNHPWYVFKGHPIPSGSETKDSLVKHEFCPIPNQLATAFKHASPPIQERPDYNVREMFVNAQWALGGEGTGAPIHFHNTAWAALVYGAKKWIIYPPHHMIMSNKQIYDFYETDMNEFMKRGVNPKTCVQTAGDVIIIPESYGHGVLNIQESIAIATEFKFAMWRIRPPPTSLSFVDAFDNRDDKRKRVQMRP